MMANLLVIKWLIICIFNVFSYKSFPIMTTKVKVRSCPCIKINNGNDGGKMANDKVINYSSIIVKLNEVSS